MELAPGSHPSTRKAAYAEAFERVLDPACAVLGALRWGSGLQLEGTPTLQSTWPDAAQQSGTETGGISVTGPAGLGAVPDALGKLPPQGPEVRQPGRAHQAREQPLRSTRAVGSGPWARSMRLTAAFTSLLISAVMLADNQEQAFSVASPTAMFSALLRTAAGVSSGNNARRAVGLFFWQNSRPWVNAWAPWGHS